MTQSLGVGSILSWKGFVFADGASSDKLLVVLGAKSGHDYLLAIATSKAHGNSSIDGCNQNDQLYFIPAGKNGFSKDTWLQLYRPRIAQAAELVKESMAQNLSVVGAVPTSIANAIRNCLKHCQDVSQAHIELL